MMGPSNISSQNCFPQSTSQSYRTQITRCKNKSFRQKRQCCIFPFLRYTRCSPPGLMKVSVKPLSKSGCKSPDHQRWNRGWCYCFVLLGACKLKNYFCFCKQDWRTCKWRLLSLLSLEDRSKMLFQVPNLLVRQQWFPSSAPKTNHASDLLGSQRADGLVKSSSVMRSSSPGRVSCDGAKPFLFLLSAVFG